MATLGYWIFSSSRETGNSKPFRQCILCHSVNCALCSSRRSNNGNNLLICIRNRCWCSKWIKTNQKKNRDILSLGKSFRNLNTMVINKLANISNKCFFLCILKIRWANEDTEKKRDFFFYKMVGTLDICIQSIHVHMNNEQVIVGNIQKWSWSYSSIGLCNNNGSLFSSISRSSFFVLRECQWFSFLLVYW